MAQQYELLQKLTRAYGVSGNETSVSSIFAAHLQPYAESSYSDALGSYCAVINGKGSLRVAIEAHLDEVGFVVRYIDPQGLIFLQPVGNWSTETAVAQRAVVQTAGGLVYGVIGCKPHHLQSDEERRSQTPLTGLWLDIGASSAEEVAEQIELGDSVSLEGSFQHLWGNRACSRCFDNRAGLYVIAEATRLFVEQKRPDSPVCLQCMACVQEEIGLRGAKAMMAASKAQIALVTDVCHTSDTPGLDKRRMGEVFLSEAPCLVRGPNVAPSVFEGLRSAAKKLAVPYQIQASAVVTGTDAAASQVANGGIATGIVALPIRYMHTPGEVIDLRVLDNAARIMAAYLCSL